MFGSTLNNFQMYYLFLSSYLYLICSFLPLWSENVVNRALAGMTQWIEHWLVNKRSPERFIGLYCWKTCRPKFSKKNSSKPNLIILLQDYALWSFMNFSADARMAQHQGNNQCNPSYRKTKTRIIWLFERHRKSLWRTKYALLIKIFQRMLIEGQISAW